MVWSMFEMKLLDEGIELRQHFRVTDVRDPDRRHFLEILSIQRRS